jgi:hypothetical protein
MQAVTRICVEETFRKWGFSESYTERYLFMLALPQSSRHANRIHPATEDT